MEESLRKSAGHDVFLLSFAPEQWNSVTKFGKFNYKHPKNKALFERGVQATSDHLQKFQVLAELASEISPGFDLDSKELDENGYSHAKHSFQFAAVAECCVNELYASLDGIRDVIFAVYSSIQGVQKKSTGKLFTKAKDLEYGDEFPRELYSALSEAHDNWFFKLRRYRTEFTHGSLGSCSKNDETGKISYMHRGMGNSSKALIIEDFVEYINEVYKNVLLVQHNVFEFFYKTLPLEPVPVLCGFNNGLAYTRLIYPETPLTFHSGVCKSAHYETPCPIRENCGAYENAETKK